MLLADYPPCDVDESHIATIYCPSCEESFCIDCDEMIHARKKNKDHTREAIEIEVEEEPQPEPEPEPEPPVPCDSDPTHEAVMFCEDCDENFCADCDYTFHSRKKTANHMRYEGARSPAQQAALKAEAALEAGFGEGAQAEDDAEAIAAEAEAAAIAAAEEAKRIEQEREAAAAAAAAASAAARAKIGVKPVVAGSKPTSTVASPAVTKQVASASTPAASAIVNKPTAAVRTATTPAAASASSSPTAAASAAAANRTTAAAAAIKKAAAAKRAASESAPSAGPVESSESSVPSSEDRVAEHKATWNELRQFYCKDRYNVGHWLGLMTEDRKELAVTLCKELLFNPQPSETRESVVTVDWNTVSYLTTYEIDVECEKSIVVNGVKKKSTVYKVHIDDMGRLQEFEILNDGVAQGGCSIM